MSHPSLITAFNENRSELLAYMAARLRCPFTAQDLVQELFLKVFALDRTSEVTNARAYVFRMAANMVVDHQRRTARLNGVLAEAQNILEAEDTASPERQAIAQEELRDLAAAVEALPPRTRSIFKRNRFEGRTQREIAEEFEISRTAVEKHIRKALAALSARRNRP